MQERKVSFFSDGYKLDGTLYLPDDIQPGERRPALIPNSGFQGFNQFYPRLFAHEFTKRGYVCLGFDYRGFAKSEGTRGRVILDEQVKDIINAITFLQTQDEVDPGRIGILGWGMGASNVVRVAAMDDRVLAVAALNGFYNGKRWLRTIHSYVDFNHLLEEVKEDRILRVVSGQSKEVETFHHYPLDRITTENVNVELSSIPGFGHPVTIEFTESILNLDAEKVVAELSPIPLFVAHGKGNLLHPLEEGQSLFAAAQEPKEFYLIDGQHNDFMYKDHPEFQALIERLVQFFAANV